MNYLKHIFRLGLIAVLLSSCIPAVAQSPLRKVVDLRADLGLSPSMSMARVSDVMTLDAAKTKYPNAYQRALALQWTDAEFIDISMFDICFMQAQWAGKGGSGLYTSYLDGQNHVEIPEGTYYVTRTGEFSGGEIRGYGCGFTDVNSTAINTKLAVWHENWNGDPNERNILQTSAWGGAGNASYLEAFSISGIRFDGRSEGFAGQTFNSCGLRLWKPGELSNVEDVWFEHFRTHGVIAYSPTPLNIGRISVFENVQGGVVATGAALSTINIGELSGDSDGLLFGSFHNGTQTGGGQWNIGAIKFEEYGAEPTRVHRDMAIGHLEGQFGVNIGTISALAGSKEIYAGFIVDTRSPTYPPQSGSIHVGSIKSAKIRNMVMQLPASGGLTGHAFATQGDYRTDGFSWSSYGGGSFNWNVAAIPVVKVAHTCTTRTSSTSACVPYRYIVVGPPSQSTTVYLDAITTPPPTACTFSYSTWSACNGGTQTRTHTSAPTGCTGTPPADSLSKSCTVTPPPSTGTAIDPNDVVIVVNTSDATSSSMASAYASAWSIPTANIISVNLGATDNLSTDALLNTARTAIAAKGKQYTVLAFGKPSRFSSQSITSAITFGKRTVSDLTASPVYGYVGVKPGTDLGVRPSMLLISANYIRRDAHGSKPAGKAYVILAKDASGTPRGSARAGQAPTGVTVFDNRTLSNVGTGENACNNLGDDCWISSRKPTGAVVAYYGSMYKLCCDAGVTWRKGFYGDHVTSFGGFLPGDATGLNSNGQTALTWHLERGAAASCGTVSEPWQGSSGSLAVQFVNVGVFHPLYLGGQPMGVACWAAIKSPDRTLIAGDLMCAPYR